MSERDRAVLRSVLGDGYVDMEAAGAALDRLAERGYIGREWLTDMLAALADEIIIQAVANDVVRGLTEGEETGDPAETEASAS